MNPLCDFSHLKFIQKEFWESQFDREKKRPKTKRNKKDVAKLILPPLMCYSWKKNQKMDDSHLILILQVGLLGFFCFGSDAKKSFADDLPHLFIFFTHKK